MNDAFEDLPDYTIPDYSAAPSLPRQKKAPPPNPRGKDFTIRADGETYTGKAVNAPFVKAVALGISSRTLKEATPIIADAVTKAVTAKFEARLQEADATINVLSSRLKATEEMLLDLIDKDDPPTTAV
ncbi:hypothetical protein Q8W25_15740 [Shimia thalassica]|uniref:hypothetical protein n=1 Tax=Shimia thalassica TaxID=1715693 RepID=UPI0027331487|nr:hypothetical protein [Shimia thalassica]MDP2495482.1 hypothetical protein [Shimia thalassica]